MRNLMQYLSQEDFKEEGTAAAALQDDSAEQGAEVEATAETADAVAPLVEGTSDAEAVVEGASEAELPVAVDAVETVSEEGFLGGLAGFIVGGAASALPGLNAGLGAAAKANLQKTKEDIMEISERIAKLRNGEIDEAVKKGTKLPAKIKRVDAVDIVKGAVLGLLFGPFYGAYKGSQMENEYKKLQEKLTELEGELKKAGVSVEDFGPEPEMDGASEGDAVGEVASTESVDAGQGAENVKANVDAAAKADPMGESEEIVLETAAEGVKATVSNESETSAIEGEVVEADAGVPAVVDGVETVSEEGFLGGLAGFILGGAASMLPGGGAVAGGAAKASLQKTKEDIVEISERIAKLRNGEIDEAAKKGTKLPASIKKVDKVDIVKGAVLGLFFGPFYGAYKGSQMENEYKKLQDKMTELERELKKAGVSVEAFGELTAIQGETVKADVTDAADEAVGESEEIVLETADDGVKATVSNESETEGGEAAAVEPPESETSDVDAPEAVEPAAPEVVEEMELELAEPEVVSEESVEEAEETLEEASEEQAEEMAELNELTDAKAEASEEVASIENFMTILQHGIKTKSYSNQFAASAQLELERVGRIMGVDQSMLPSLEDYGQDALEQYYTTSLETFTGFFKRLTDVADRLGETLAKKANNKTFVERPLKQAKAVNTLVDDAIAKLDGNKIDGKVVVQVKSIEKRLAVGDTMEADILASVAGDQKLLAAIVGSGFSAVNKYVDTMIDVLDEASTKGGVGKTGPIVAKIAGMAYPADSFPADAYSKGLLGGSKLVRGDKKGGDDSRSKIAVIGKNAIPKIESASFRFAKKTEVTIDHAGVARLLKTAKAYVAIAEKVANGSMSKSLDSYVRQVDAVRRNLVSGQATSWGEGKDSATLIDQIPAVIFQHLDLMDKTSSHCLDVAKTLVKFANLAMKAKPAAAE